MTMLSTCCTCTKTVLVLLIAAATLQLGVASPIVRQETNESCRVNLTSAEANLRDGLFVTANFIAFISFNISCNETGLWNATDTDLAAIEKACDLLGHYYLLNGSGIFNNSNILHIVLKQNVLDACTHWVKSGNSNCTVENLKELANKCHDIRLSTMVDETYRLSTMVDEAFNKTNEALLGDCNGPTRDECGWLQRILVLEGCNKFNLTTVLQPPFVLRE